MIDLLGDADRSREVFERLVGRADRAFDGGKRGDRSDLARSIADLDREPQRLLHPLAGLPEAALAMVDQGKGDQHLACQVETVGAACFLADRLEELERLLGLTEDLKHHGVAKAKLERCLASL